MAKTAMGTKIDCADTVINNVERAKKDFVTGLLLANRFVYA
jgi:hypothetical protein